MRRRAVNRILIALGVAALVVCVASAIASVS
jgi:hypothetical protein